MKIKLINLRIEDVISRSRVREELGNLTALESSIKEFGVLSPILVTQQNVLVSGQRRLSACINLGMTEIPALVIDFSEEIDLLNIESQMNFCIKSLTAREVDKAIEMKKRLIINNSRKENILGRAIKNFFSGFGRLFSKDKK